jgi:phytoene synthase
VSVRSGLALRGHLTAPRGAPAPRDLAEARDTTHRRASTFSLACRMLPAAIRNDVYLLYLVFRTLDDLVDEQRPEAADRVEAASAWAQGLPGERTREVVLLDRIAAAYPIPRCAIADFCEGMRQDLRRELLVSEADVDRYSYRVAGAVGIVMTALLGAEDPVRAHGAAAALGMAMQRTNILRDIDEDAARGRVYIAQESIARFGSPAPGLREPLLRDQIARADALYEQGLAGVEQLKQGRRAVAAAGAMYREILREIERRGYGASPGRAVVSMPRKAPVALRAMRLAA